MVQEQRAQWVAVAGQRGIGGFRISQGAISFHPIGVNGIAITGGSKQILSVHRQVCNILLEWRAGYSSKHPVRRCDEAFYLACAAARGSARYIYPGSRSRADCRAAELSCGCAF